MAKQITRIKDGGEREGRRVVYKELPDEWGEEAKEFHDEEPLEKHTPPTEIPRSSEMEVTGRSVTGGRIFWSNNLSSGTWVQVWWSPGKSWIQK